MRIGFQVATWVMKHSGEYSLEELLEYWHTLRKVARSGELGPNPKSSELYIVELQEELVRRFNNYSEQIEKLKEANWEYRQQIEAIRERVWLEDIPHPAVPEDIEHHERIQRILKYIDEEVIKC